MEETNFTTRPKWFKGSRDRGYRGNYININNIPEFLHLKNIQEFWDSEENHPTIAA